MCNKSDKGLVNNLNTITDLNLVQDGDSIFPPGRRFHLRHHTGKKTATGSQIEAGICGKHHPGLNSNFFFFVQRCHSACWKFYLLAIEGEEGGVDRHTYRAPHFSCTVVAQPARQCAHSPRTRRSQRLLPGHLQKHACRAQEGSHSTTNM